jgi:hypothetical protein
MQTMKISLPDPEQKRKAKEALEQTLLDTINEGEAEEATPEWWAKLRAEITARYGS